MRKKSIRIAAGLLFAVMLVLAFSWRSFFVTRMLAWNNVAITDYEIFPERTMRAADPAFRFPVDTSRFDLAAIDAGFRERFGFKRTERLEELLQVTGTTAFLILKNDTLIFERYMNGYDRNSINTSFSISKSVASALVGISIGEGAIGSVADPIADYFPELEGEAYREITLRHLLTMSSGIAYDDDGGPFSDDARAYYEPDLRAFALNFKPAAPPAKKFQYNNIHPLLIGMILERTTGTTVTQYLESRLWLPMGAEFAGSWSLDNSGFEKMESGINARAIDFLKFGRLFLHRGNWNGNQLIPEAFVLESTRLGPEDGSWQKNIYRTIGYKYFWWVLPRESSGDDFYAEGNLGQFVFVSPATRTVIVRHGKEYGYGRWPEFFQKLTNAIQTTGGTGVAN